MPIDLEELKRLLPKLIRENDAIKGAIIGALSGVVATHEDIKETNRNMNTRFEALQKEMGDRFEALQKEMDNRFVALQKEMDDRFTKMDERFEKINLRMEKGFAELGEAIKILNISINRIESKEGRLIEKVILDILKEAFILEDINPKNIQKVSIEDESGEIFFPGYQTDVDIVARNGNIYIFEIKATVDHHDIAHFLQNTKLYEHVTGKKITKAYIVALRMNPLATN
jgi:hypothetical protein